MSHSVTLSDETYDLLARLAESTGKDAAAYLAEMVAAAWEAVCAQYDAAFERDESWLAGAQEALDEIARGEAQQFASTEEFVEHLDSAPIPKPEDRLPMQDGAHADAR